MRDQSTIFDFIQNKCDSKSISNEYHHALHNLLKVAFPMTLWTITFFCEWTQQGEMSLLKIRYLPAILYDFSVDEKFPHINWDSPRLCNWCPPKLLEFIKQVLSKSNNHLNIFFPQSVTHASMFYISIFFG